MVAWTDNGFLQATPAGRSRLAPEYQPDHDILDTDRVAMEYFDLVYVLL